MIGSESKLKSTIDGRLAQPDPKHSVEGLVQRVVKELHDGVHHGHFDLSISGRHGRGDNLEVIVKAGKHYRFLIPISSIQR